MKSLMVVPYISNKTLTRYFQYLIEGYTFQPDKIDYRGNDLRKPQYQNMQDIKAIDSFSKYRPTDYLIIHASDIYLMPNDLDDMITELICDEKAFITGLYPIKNFVHCSMNEPSISPARISVWKADIFNECLKEFKTRQMKTSGIWYDEVYRMAEIAVEKGYHCLISKTARPQRIFEEEFKTMRIR